MSSIFKVAILIDGGYFLQRFKTNTGTNPRVGDLATFINETMDTLKSYTPNGCSDILLRSFYYDCRPFGDEKTDPNGNKIDFSTSAQFKAANAFQNDLRQMPQMALRLGDLSFDGWKVDPNNPSKYWPDFKQKAVDMKIGLDIAWMAGKRTIDKLVLVAGDSDFVSPMKFARKEGILVYLHTMGQQKIKGILREHADFVIEKNHRNQAVQ